MELLLKLVYALGTNKCANFGHLNVRFLVSTSVSFTHAGANGIIVKLVLFLGLSYQVYWPDGPLSEISSDVHLIY
jgi:hypothetical protein